MLVIHKGFFALSASACAIEHAERHFRQPRCFLANDAFPNPAPRAISPNNDIAHRTRPVFEAQLDLAFLIALLY